MPFLCECADDDCLSIVNVRVSDWEVVGSKPNHFLMEAGHERIDGEEVVGRITGYAVARKPD